jgi:hypothetical protein
MCQFPNKRNSLGGINVSKKSYLFDGGTLDYLGKPSSMILRCIFVSFSLVSISNESIQWFLSLPNGRHCDSTEDRVVAEARVVFI